jgi:hypothetical protein
MMIDPLSAKLLQFITDIEKVNQINKNLHQVVSCKPRSGQPPDLFITKVANWIAVPILEPFYVLTSTLLKRLEVTLLESGQELFAVTFPHYGLPSFTYNVPLTEDALREVEILSPFIAVLFSGTPDSSWFFLSIETDYCIMIGLSEFINEFFEHKVEEKLSELYSRSLIDKKGSNPSSQSYYPYSSFIYDQLRKYNDAEAGAKFSLSF